MIWEPFILALVLGIIVSAGLYFAYLWQAPEADDASGGEPSGGEPIVDEPPPASPAP